MSIQRKRQCDECGKTWEGLKTSNCPRCSTKENLSQVIETWQKENHAYHFEGASGVRKLEDFCRDLGYRDGAFYGDVPILNFLADNPGAIQAILTWVAERDIPEWIENLESELSEEEENEEN